MHLQQSNFFFCCQAHPVAFNRDKAATEGVLFIRQDIDDSQKDQGGAMDISGQELEIRGFLQFGRKKLLGEQFPHIPLDLPDFHTGGKQVVSVESKV
jgi:hypothetical protein